MRYYLGPWQWLTTPMPHFAPPALTRGLIDFGTIPQMSTPGSARAVGLFATDAVLPSEYFLLGDGDLRSIAVNNMMRDAFLREVGYRPQGDTLAELLYDALTSGSDPDGGTAVKTLMPTVDGWLEVHLGGHSPVCNARFEWGKPCSRGRNPTAKIQALLRAEFRKHMNDAQAGKLRNARGQVDNEMHLKILDAYCEKYRVDDWKQFVPQDLQRDVPGRKKHETTITESFNTADSTTLGPDLSWTEIAGNLQVFSNRCTRSNLGALESARADSDLSSTDHYSQGVVQTGGVSTDVASSTVFRKDGTATLTYYRCQAYFNGGLIRLLKDISGTPTVLNSTSQSYSTSTNYTIKGEANGSTIKSYQDGVEKASVTDSAISSGVRCGVEVYELDGGGNIPTIDSFEAADLGGGGGGILYTQLEKTTRGYLRGVYEGST